VRTVLPGNSAERFIYKGRAPLRNRYASGKIRTAHRVSSACHENIERNWDTIPSQFFTPSVVRLPVPPETSVRVRTKVRYIGCKTSASSVLPQARHCMMATSLVRLLAGASSGRRTPVSTVRASRSHGTLPAACPIRFSESRDDSEKPLITLSHVFCSPHKQVCRVHSNLLRALGKAFVPSSPSAASAADGFRVLKNHDVSHS